MMENQVSNPQIPDEVSYAVEETVHRRYEQGAHAVQPALCCPVPDYEGQYLRVLPQEILEKDYGCGDPSKYVGAGETVVDLGSGAGKICYILAQKVGSEGQVIGVDFNDHMLCVARKYQEAMATRIGYNNVRFVKAKIQDLALDLDRAAAWLADHPIHTIEDLSAFEAECGKWRYEQPLIEDESVDVIVSNCVLNLVKPADKKRLFAEVLRTLKRGGRAVISDIVCDEDPTPTILDDPDLWSGCIAGAFREDMLLKMFEAAGFYGIEILARSPQPWQTIDGIEFRSMTVQAYKGKDGPCLERNQAVVYKGPWRSVTDDDGHVLHRGRRMAVCDKTFGIYTDPAGPYAHHIEPVQPLTEVLAAKADPFQCQGAIFRDPRRTKGHDYRETVESDSSMCAGSHSCC